MARSLVEQQFGRHAANYVTSPPHAKGASLQRLVELVKPGADWQALDIATAAGHTAFAFAPHVAHVIASDITDEMLVEAAKLAKSRGIGNVTFAKADAQALPFENGRFDLVTCRIAPHHFPDIPRFIAEVWRVLKPGGTFALVDNVSPDAETTPGFTSDELKAAAETYNTHEKLRDPSHGRCLTSAEWRDVITGAGFDITHVEHLAKDMEFRPWVDRMEVPANLVPRLEAMLLDAAPALAAFLRPRKEGDKLLFALDEIVIIARKSQACRSQAS